MCTLCPSSELRTSISQSHTSSPTRRSHPPHGPQSFPDLHCQPKHCVITLYGLFPTNIACSGGTRTRQNTVADGRLDGGRRSATANEQQRRQQCHHRRFGFAGDATAASVFRTNVERRNAVERQRRQWRKWGQRKRQRQRRARQATRSAVLPDQANDIERTPRWRWTSGRWPSSSR